MIGHSIARAKQVLERGDVVAIPTETVYGLAGNAYKEETVEKIFTIKQRPHTSPLILHTDSLEKVESFVQEIPPQALLLARTYWPGPLTLVLPKSASISDRVTAGLPTIGIRIPDHPLTLALLASLSFPLVAPSANPFGYISPTTAAHVAEQLGEKIPYILDGGSTTRGLESTIVALTAQGPVIYRRGSLTQEDIEQVLGCAVPYLTVQKGSKSAHLSPGRAARHYAPHTPIVIGDLEKLACEHQGKRIAALCFQHSIPGISMSDQTVLSSKGSLQEAGKNLFAALRHLDKLGADIIIAPVLPDEGIGRVINERLARTSGHS